MTMLEARDFITEGHADRLQCHVDRLATSLGFSGRLRADLTLFAKFHDIGKVGVPDSILFKPRPLTKEELVVMRGHSEIGHRIALSTPDVLPVADWILKHHECRDGSGYPIGLSKHDIPLECRMLALAAAFDAMTNDRP
jgi:HD-GYP domain-containing protein (c-di-GMP phosphodiesterase class II)